MLKDGTVGGGEARFIGRGPSATEEGLGTEGEAYFTFSIEGDSHRSKPQK